MGSRNFSFLFFFLNPKTRCAEHGLELLEADMESSPARDSAGKSLLDDCSDEEPRGKGKERMLEAFLSNMWPVMKKKEVAALPPPSTATTTTTTTATAAAAAPGLKDASPAKPFDPLSLLEGEDGVDGPDQFERALTAAREMREHALSLPDEERREFAGKMSMYLLSLMGGLDDDDDDDGDQEEFKKA